jgi:hypothetical protein
MNSKTLFIVKDSKARQRIPPREEYFFIYIFLPGAVEANPEVGRKDPSPMHAFNLGECFMQLENVQLEISGNYRSKQKNNFHSKFLFC